MIRYRTMIAVGASLSLTLAAGALTVADDGEDILVTGGEYFFEGIPAELQTGTDLSFTNGGEEYHELAIARVADDVTLTTPEILAMGEAALTDGIVVLAGQILAGPGEDAMGEVNLNQPGRTLRSVSSRKA